MVEYEPFGKFSRQEKYGSTEDVARFYFTGQRYDDDTELYYYNARYYDPGLGRFIQADKVVQYPYNPQNFNRYSYAHNNPVNLVDPSGEFAWFAALAFVAKAAVAGAVIGAAVGGVVGGIQAAIQGTSIWAGIGSGLLSGAISGLAGGASFGMGAVGLTILGPTVPNMLVSKLVLGAFSGAVGGGAGSAFSGGSFASGAMWGAATGLAFTGAALTPVGQKIGEALGRTGLGKGLGKLSSWVGDSYADFYIQTHGGKSVGSVPAAFDNADEAWHLTNKQGLEGIKASGGFDPKRTFVFNPDEAVGGVKMRDMSIKQMQDALGIPSDRVHLLKMQTSEVVLTIAPDGKPIAQNVISSATPASQAGIYGIAGRMQPLRFITLPSQQRYSIGVTVCGNGECVGP